MAMKRSDKKIPDFRLPGFRYEKAKEIAPKYAKEPTPQTPKQFFAYLDSKIVQFEKGGNQTLNTKLFENLLDGLPVFKNKKVSVNVADVARDVITGVALLQRYLSDPEGFKEDYSGLTRNKRRMANRAFNAAFSELNKKFGGSGVAFSAQASGRNPFDPRKAAIGVQATRPFDRWTTAAFGTTINLEEGQLEGSTLGLTHKLTDRLTASGQVGDMGSGIGVRGQLNKKTHFSAGVDRQYGRDPAIRGEIERELFPNIHAKASFKKEHGRKPDVGVGIEGKLKFSRGGRVKSYANPPRRPKT